MPASFAVAASAPSERMNAHFSGPRAEPITVIPLALAIWTTADPTAPVTEQQLLNSLGEETARVLRSAQESAEEIRSRAAVKADPTLPEARLRLADATRLPFDDRSFDVVYLPANLHNRPERIPAAVEQAVAEMRADKSCGTGNESFRHRLKVKG